MGLVPDTALGLDRVVYGGAVNIPGLDAYPMKKSASTLRVSSIQCRRPHLIGIASGFRPFHRSPRSHQGVHQSLPFDFICSGQLIPDTTLSLFSGLSWW
jgi:hypothetical protein